MFWHALAFPKKRHVYDFERLSEPDGTLSRHPRCQAPVHDYSEEKSPPDFPQAGRETKESEAGIEHTLHFGGDVYAPRL
jgi:hypothetical protein